MSAEGRRRIAMAHFGTVVAMVLLSSLVQATCINGGDPHLCETREILFSGAEAQPVADKAADLGSAVAIYEYLRNNAIYTPYHGARSNSVNTVLGMRGNDVDLATAFIAMLRSQGIKSRYAAGQVRVARGELANWLGVIDPGLAVEVLRNQGIQGIDDSDPQNVSFEHTWVEALVDYHRYRGAKAATASGCATEGDGCLWVPLDVSFKQRVFDDTNRLALKELNFDYDAYYNAQNPGDPAFQAGLKNLSPLEIFEQQALEYLRQNYPGLTLDDVIGDRGIVEDRSGLLPASLAYEIVSLAGQFDSIDGHDLASITPWRKMLNASLSLAECPSLNINASVDVSELSTKKLTVTLFDDGNDLTLGYRLDGQQGILPAFVLNGSLLCNGSPVTSGTPLVIDLEIDAEPGRPPIAVRYENLIVGGYYLIATGGETSNWTQVERAFEQLLEADEQFPIVVDTAGALGTPDEVYIDENASGSADAGDSKLVENLPAQDALTGGLLFVAQSLYYTQLREDAERYSTLTGIVSPVSAYLGVVSTTENVEYIDELPFAITPDGLLIDLKGIRLNGTWEIDQLETFSNRGFKFIGHVASSLEHEVWQQITGYDAISTVRGMQFAREQNKTLIDLRYDGGINNFPSEVYNLGFSNSAPADFQQFDWSIFGRELVSWQYKGSDPNAAFNLFNPDISGLTLSDTSTNLLTYTDDNGAGLGSYHETLEFYDAALTFYDAQIPTENDLNQWSPAPHVSSDYQSFDVLSTTSATAGINVSAVRASSNSYQFNFAETTELSDGAYSVPVVARLGQTNNQYTLAIPLSFTAGFVNVQSVTAGGNFNVAAYSQSSGTLTVNLSQSGANGNGIYNIVLRIWAGLSYADTNPIAVEVYNNRLVAFNGTWITYNDLVVDDIFSLTCQGSSYQGLPSALKAVLQTCFDSVDTAYGDFDDFLDKDQGFDPTTYAFRSTSLDIDEYEIDFIVNGVRNHLYLTSGSDIRYLLPARLPTDSNYVFSTYLRDTYSAEGDLSSSTYAIANFSDRLVAGGGFVTADEAINPANNTDFDNEVFTDLSVVAATNNDLVITPSTLDPVSTVTGNMYHDETDLEIKGRGLNYALTRTYNSADTTDGPLGIGWSHSYGMTLTANDYGQFPNDTTAVENANGTTSSITYLDERGGEKNYVVDDGPGGGGSYAVAAPTGVYDLLALDTPAVGQHTISFRNGVEYIFEGGDLRVPGTTARLLQIRDPYGNALNLSYGSNGLLANVIDNLNVPGRTGLTFTYYPEPGPNANKLQSVTDWAGRSISFLYDPSDRLIRSTNLRGDPMDYTYHPENGLLNEIIHPEDRGRSKKQMAFSYYENGQAYAYVDQLGQEEALTYDLFRKTTRITNPRGYASEHHYDERGALTKLVSNDGAIRFYANSADGVRYEKIDPLGNRTSYSYQANRSPSDDTSISDNFGRISRESDALNQSTDFDYGIYDQPTITLDKRGNPTTRHYHATTDINANSVAGKLARIEATINGVANVILEEYAYYADAAQTNFGQIKQRVEYIDQNDSARQRITDYVYHPNGIDLHQQTVSGATTGGSVTTEFSYDLLGRVLTETLQRRRSAIDPTLESLVTTFEYDALNRVVKITNPRGDISETVYDANGQVAEEKIHYATTIAKNGCAAPSGGFVTCTVAIHAYDAADRRISTTDVFGNTVMFEYDEVGNLTAETDANGHTTRFDYDEMDRRDAIIDANGHRTEMSYDLAGRLVATKDANGNRTQSEYDALGRVTKTISQAGRETIFDYDENGNQTHLTDANAVAGSQPKNNENASVYAEFDELNRPILARDATNGETISTYDLLGNITSITDAEGQVTTFIYDDLGRLIETIDPIIESPTDKTERITQYDQAGNVLESEDRTGRIARHTYDVLNRRTQTDYLSDATSEMLIYDDYGDLVSLANDEVTYSYSYDARHSMLSKTDSRLGKGMSWTYDPVGNIKTKTNYEGDVTTFQYDSTNRLVAMTNPSFLQVSYHYDGAGRLLNRILSNGAKTDYAYDEDNRLTGLKNVSADGTVIEDLIYTHDEVGNISSITDNASSESTAYVYDALYRLIDVDSTVNAQDRTYTYDAVGNRKTLLANGTMHHYCYHPTDCSQGPQGNRLHNIRVGSPTGSFHREFTYDDAGRLDTKLDASGGLMVNLTYDGKGNVAEISTSSQTHNFAYDPNAYRIEKDTKHYHLEGEHLEASYDASGTLEEKYLRGVVIDEIVNGFHYLSSDPNDWTNYTFHHDQINSVTALTGHAGAIEEEIRYDAFGAPLTLPTPGTGNDLTYTGREYDRDTGLYYYRARYYDAEIGRFTAEDPLGFQAGDVNFYAYVANRPMVENDPTGKICGSGLCIGGLILGRTVGPPIARFLASNTVRSSVISGSVAGTAGGVGTFITSGGDLKMAGQAFGANFAGAALLGPAIGSRANLILGTNARSTLTANLLTTGIVDSTTQLLRDGQVDLLRSGLALGATAFGTFLLTDGLLTAGSTALTDVALVEGIQTALGVAGDFTFQAANKVRQNLYPVNGRGANAAGGFVLYPGRANTNQQLVVYEK